jgi:hypothetical protein
MQSCLTVARDTRRAITNARATRADLRFSDTDWFSRLRVSSTFVMFAD